MRLSSLLVKALLLLGCYGHTLRPMRCRPRASTRAATPSVCTRINSNDDAAEPSYSFGPINVPEALLQRLDGAGYKAPMQIQRNAMPLICNGQNVILHAATGSGKTLAFLVPLLATMTAASKGIDILLVSPSQELAVQLAAAAQQLLSAEAVLLAISAGFTSDEEQEGRLCTGTARVLVGTPQRLLDLLSLPAGRRQLASLRTLVLDEVDLLFPDKPTALVSAPTLRYRKGIRGVESGKRAAASSFRGSGRGSGQRRVPTNPAASSIERRLAQKRPAQLLIELLLRRRPAHGKPLQLVCSSATVRPELRRRLDAMLGWKGKKSAITVVTAAPFHPPPSTLKQRGVGSVVLPSTLTHVAYVGHKEAAMLMLRTALEEAGIERPLVVLPNGQSAQKLVGQLRRDGFDAIALHKAFGLPAASEGDVAVASEKSAQQATLEQHTQIAATFKSTGGVTALPLLVTTEHGARGLDLKRIDCVILFGLPLKVDAYVHVVGRTAREGRRGRAASLLFSEAEQARLGDFKRELGIKVETVDLSFLRP